RFVLTAAAGSMLVMSKETALLLPCVLLAWTVGDACVNRRKKPWRHSSHELCSVLAPILLFCIWSLYLNCLGKHSWTMANWSATAKDGSFYTVLYNLMHFDIFNGYFQHHLQQFLLLNYTYLYLAIIYLGALIYTYN